MSDTDFNIDDLMAPQNTGDTEQLVRDVLAGEMPTVPQPEEPVIVLPRGRFLNGEWEKEATVRELTGADEEKLARKRDSMDFFDAVLALGVERLGTAELSKMHTSEREAVLGSLLTGERELLFLAVIRATFGNERDLEYTCGSCGSEFTTTLLLDHDFVLTDTLGTEPPLSYTFTTSKGDRVEYRLINGFDQRAASSKKNGTVAEQNTAILTSVVKTVNGDVPFDTHDFVLKLSMRDRRDLVKDLDEHQPSIDNELELECQTCGTKNKVFLNWGDLFRP